MSGPSPCGLLLAAGAGRRSGGPKALRHDADGTSWLRRGVAVLQQGGCTEVLVVLGSGADEAELLLAGPAGREPVASVAPRGPVRVVRADDWSAGMSRSLAAGLAAVAPGTTQVLVHLVDLPDVTAVVVRRVLAAGRGAGALCRASYRGVPGHPVLVGADHLAALRAELQQLTGARADAGGRGYLVRAGAVLVECGDLASGQDRDTPG